MNYRLISQVDAITVLSALFPEERWDGMLEEHFNLFNLEGMNFLEEEEVIEFVVTHSEGIIGPQHMRVFCVGFLKGIETQKKHQLENDFEDVLIKLGSCDTCNQEGISELGAAEGVAA